MRMKNLFSDELGCMIVLEFDLAEGELYSDKVGH